MGYNSYYYKNQVDKCFDLAKKGVPIAVIDLETTGFSPEKNYIFEFAGIKFIYDKDYNPRIIDKRAYLIHPAEPLSDKITKITGFTNNDVADKPTEAEMFSKIKSFMDNTILCSHNTDFETKFMKALYFRYQSIFNPIDVLDTLKMSRDLHKEEKTHKLSDISKRYGFDKGLKFHDARDDTTACYRALNFFKSEYDDVDNSSENTKIAIEPTSIRFWEGPRHDMKRLYIATNYGTVWWSTFNKSWGEKDKGTIDAINMSYLEKRVLEITKCANFDELSKFRGSIKC